MVTKICRFEGSQEEKYNLRIAQVKVLSLLIITFDVRKEEN